MRPYHGRSAAHAARAFGTIVVPNGRRAVAFRIGPLVWRLLATGCLVVVATSPVPARCRGTAGAPGSTVFTASDFAALSRGVDFNTSGEAAVSVWAPGGQQWQLTQNGETVELQASTDRRRPTAPVAEAGNGDTSRRASPEDRHRGREVRQDQDRREVETNKTKADSKVKEAPAPVPTLMVIAPESEARA